MPDTAGLITGTADGVVLMIKVVPRSGRSTFDGLRGGAFLVRLLAPPVEGAANAELVALVAAALQVPRRDVSIQSGEHARGKRVLVKGITPAYARTRLLADQEPGAPGA
jgi:uncharacterized protein (TIGR00251 family)